MTEAQAEDKASGRKKRVVPTQPGEKDSAGYEFVAKKGDLTMIKTPSGKFAVYKGCWQKDEELILRAVKDESVAKSVLETGKVPEKPAKPAKESAPTPK